MSKTKSIYAVARPIPIRDVEIIAKNYGYDQVCIIARKTGNGGCEHMTTYGITKEHCNIVAKWGKFLQEKVMGWSKENG